MGSAYLELQNFLPILQTNGLTICVILSVPFSTLQMSRVHLREQAAVLHLRGVWHDAEGRLRGAASERGRGCVGLGGCAAPAAAAPPPAHPAHVDDGGVGQAGVGAYGPAQRGNLIRIKTHEV